MIVSSLIYRAVDTLGSRTLDIEECVIIALVCLIFLMHARSALVAIHHASYRHIDCVRYHARYRDQLKHYEFGRDRHRDGAMVDAAVVMVENAHKHLERADPAACASRC